VAEPSEARPQSGTADLDVSDPAAIQDR
jgi:hypothetical protein